MHSGILSNGGAGMGIYGTHLPVASAHEYKRRVRLPTREILSFCHLVLSKTIMLRQRIEKVKARRSLALTSRMVIHARCTVIART
jgi:hypothetical protein